MNNSIAIVNCGLFAKEMVQSGIPYYDLYASNKFFPFWVGKISRKIRSPKWTNINPELQFLKSDCIVVFDSGITDNFILNWLADKCGDKRLIFYYWNPVFTSIHPDKIPSKFEKWSYSPSDCEKYGMKYNSTFYFESLLKKPVPIKRDVFFIGKNKGREASLLEIRNYLESAGLSTFFYITANHPRFKQKKYRKPIPYKDVLNYVNESNSVLDYYVDPNAGLSLRAMESIFFEKKLITNNRTIVNYDFYKKENVLLLEKAEKKDVELFLSSQFAPIDPEIRKRYLFENWIKNFVK